MADLQNLRSQVDGLIQTSKTVLTAKSRELPPVDETTLALAQAIIKEAKTLVPDDNVLAAMKLAPPVSWTSLLAAMETIYCTLPLPKMRMTMIRRRPYSR